MASALEVTTKSGAQFVKVKNTASMIRRMAPLYGKYMKDPTTRSELLTLIAQ